ncbi:tyrosine-protein phosphatase [Pseudomonas sp. BN607]|nr:tyrosine-protein phosphatase [Pseudomonas sp. BN607]
MSKTLNLCTFIGAFVRGCRFMNSDKTYVTRRLALDGAVNFRDMGGYEASCGRQIKGGVLYRSDSLAELTAKDMSAIQALRLRSVIDLRHNSERLAKPNRLLPSWGGRTHALGFLPHGATCLFEAVRSRSIDAAQARESLCSMYRHLPTTQCKHFAQVLQVLLQEHSYPALIHCTSGKDRTGFAIAVVLMALGVSRETIMQDYLLTNDYRRDLSFMLGEEVEPEVMAIIKSASAEYLQAAFDVIDRVYGSSELFLLGGLGLTFADLRRLERFLLA